MEPAATNETGLGALITSEARSLCLLIRCSAQDSNLEGLLTGPVPPSFQAEPAAAQATLVSCDQWLIESLLRLSHCFRLPRQLEMIQEPYR